jgi:hypothetical protein
MIERLQAVPGIGASLKLDDHEHLSPRVEITFDDSTGVSAQELIAALEEGNPRVYLFEPNGPSAIPNSIIIHCHTMQPGEEEVVAEVLRAAILKRLPAHMSEAMVTD